MRPLRMGVLGCADIARRRMLPAMVAHPRIELVALASRDASRAAGFAHTFGCRPVHGYRALLQRDDIDAVYVPLPAALHEEWTRAALESGRHVLVEKPVTTDTGRTAELLALARERGLMLSENVMFVHHHQHRRVRRLVERGRIGELRGVRAVFQVPELPATDIRYRPELGGGALWDVGLYPARLALHLLGSDLTVAGAERVVDPGREVDTAGAAVLHAPDGVVVQLDWGIGRAYRSFYELTGSTGRITVERAFTPPAGQRPAVRVERDGTVDQPHWEPDDQVANALSAFVAAVRSGAEPDPAPLLQIDLLERIHRVAAGASGPGVRIDLNFSSR